MRPALLTRLRCPACMGGLSLVEPKEIGGRVESGWLTCSACAADYPVVRFVPRFVPGQNYADSFGFQWNRFRKTQLDSHSGLSISRERFFASTGWSEAQLSGASVLDVGCGAGRFAEIALAAGAAVTAIDYSTAVDACFQNLGEHPRLDIVQADVYRLPFAKESFDLVYCLGVLQHTPDVPRAFIALTAQVRRGGGRLAVDVYPRLWLNALWSKYWIRPLTKRMSRESLLGLVEWMVRWLLPLSVAAGRVPLVGRRLRYAFPLANYEPDFPLSAAQLREWAVLDTFDMLSPAHDHPQSVATVRHWFEAARLCNVEVFRKGSVIGRGARP